MAFLLWPDSSEAQARTNLRHVLHTLRRSLPDADRFLEVTPRTLRWRPTLRCGSTSPRSRRRSRGRATTTSTRCARPSTPTRGDLLEGSYDEWLLEERERLRQRHARRARAPGPPAGRRGGTARAIRAPSASCATTRCASRPTGCSCACTTRAATARGRCASTTPVPRRCERELGVEPSAPTREPYEALLPAGAGEGEARVPEPRGTRAPGDARGRRRPGSALVGRSARADAPDRALALGPSAAARSSCSSAASPASARPPGRGAALVVRAPRRRHRRGARVPGRGRGRLRAGGRLAALGGARAAAARGSTARAWPSSRALLPRDPGARGRSRCPRASSASGCSTRSPRRSSRRARRSCSSPTTCTGSTARRSSSCTTSCAAAPDAPLLVAATARREELDPGDPLERARHRRCRRSGAVSEIELGRLSREETAVLAGRRITRAPLDDADGRPPVRRVRGQPALPGRGGRPAAPHQPAAACRR